MASLQKLFAGNAAIRQEERLQQQEDGELQSPEKYKAVVQHLVQYTSVLADMGRQLIQQQQQQGEESGGRARQEQERARSLQALCRLEDVLERYFPPPAPPAPLPASPDIHADADTDSSASLLLLLAKDAKHCSLLSTLSDLKQHVLLGEGGGGEGGADPTPLAAASLSLCSVSVGGRVESVSDGSVCAAGTERCGTSETNEEADDAVDDDDEEDGDDRMLGGGGAGGRAGGGAEGRKVKRLNKSCTSVLTVWLLDHLEYPFPTPQEKTDLGAMLSLEPSQVIATLYTTHFTHRHSFQ